MVALATVASLSTISAQTARVMTYNIRLDIASDNENRWDARKVELVGVLKNYKAEFIGLQEALINQMEYIDSALVDHAYTGVGRDDGAMGGEFTGLFYDTTRFEIVEATTFWLSEISDTVSIGWDAMYPRTCTWALFSEKETGRKLYVYNTHYDHVGKVARASASRLIIDRIGQGKPTVPVVLMGDFNATQDQEPVQVILNVMRDGKDASQSSLIGPVGTWNGFDPMADIKRCIDYIFVRGANVTTIEHVSAKRSNGLQISDHLAVVADVQF